MACNIIISAKKFITLYNVFLHSFGAKEKQRHIRINIANLLSQCKAIHIRHHYIEQAYVKFLTLKRGEAKPSISSKGNIVVV